MSEHDIQNRIRTALCGKGLFFRVNVGSGWTGTGKAFVADRPMAVPVQKGDVVLKQARRFTTGVPEGFSDLFGLVEVTITPDMVGQTIAQFVAIEVKDEDGRLRKSQGPFLAAVTRKGGRAGVARSVEDALELLP